MTTAIASPVAPVRPSPWTKLGAPIDLRDADDRTILARAGLDWKVRLAGLYTDGFSAVDGFRATVREDSGRALGVVGLDYQPLQNDQSLGLLRHLAQHAPVRIETAGSFKHGAQTWFQAKIDGMEIRVGDDVTECFLLASNSFDGSRAFMLGLQGRRVVCQNTLALANAQVQGNRRRTDLAKGHVIRHTKGMTVALQDALDTYTSALAARKVTQAAYEHLASVPSLRALERAFLDRVFAAPNGPDESGRAAALKKSREERIRQTLASATSNVRGTAGSAFALLQSVVEYADFFRPTRTSDGENADAARLFSANFGGSGADLKERAWATILDLTHA